jgi:uncharacterized protein (UPF0254 family)
MQNLFTDLASGLTPVLYVFGKILSIVGIIAGMIQDIISGIGVLFGMDMPESSATAGALKVYLVWKPWMMELYLQDMVRL